MKTSAPTIITFADARPSDGRISAPTSAPAPNDGGEEPVDVGVRVQRRVREHRQRDVEVEGERADHERQPEHEHHARLLAHVREALERAAEDRRPLELLEQEEVARAHREAAPSSTARKLIALTRKQTPAPAKP